MNVPGGALCTDHERNKMVPPPVGDVGAVHWRGYVVEANIPNDDLVLKEDTIVYGKPQCDIYKNHRTNVNKSQ